MIQAMGIKVHEEAPQEDEQLFSEPAVVASNEEEEDAAEEAAAAIAALDAQFARTTDPVRMYMRELGRSDERRVGQESVRTCESLWSTYQYKKKKTITQQQEYNPQN